MNRLPFINSAINDYDEVKFDSFLSPSIKKELYNDDFYYDDGVNLSNNKFFSEINLYDTMTEYLNHRNDQILEIGYDYQNRGILTHAIAGIFFLEPKRKAIINQIDKLFIFMVNHIKSIKKSYNFMLPKNYIKFN